MSLAAAPDYHLTRALTTPLQRLPAGACPLPSPGDLPLATAVLGTASGGVAEAQDLVRSVMGHQGPGGAGSAGSPSSVASYATVQRAVMAGVHAHALRALRSLQPGRDSASLLCGVLECDPLQLLAKVGLPHVQVLGISLAQGRAVYLLLQGCLCGDWHLEWPELLTWALPVPS